MRAGIVGLGLIGGSLARALTRAGWEVAGLDRRDVARRALAAGAIARSVDRLEELEGDLLVLAAPPDVNVKMLQALGALRPKTTVVTDVSSVKGPICAAARRSGLRRFVGGHPMAGSEGSGFEASDGDLFRGRPWILTGGEGLHRVKTMVRAAGARPVRLSPGEHDRTVAFLSHLPQLVAWALQGTAESDPVASAYLGLAGPGWRSMTRLAQSPATLWGQILRQNAPEVERALRAFARRLRVAGGLVSSPKRRSPLLAKEGYEESRRRRRRSRP